MQVRLAAAVIWGVINMAGMDAWGQNLTHIKVEGYGAAWSAERLRGEGFDVLNGSIRFDYFEAIVTEVEMDILRDRGIDFKVIATGRPFRKIQAERQSNAADGGVSIAAVPEGYKDLSTILSEMNTAAANYPTICRVVDLTDTYGAPATHYGRHLYAVKISDNVQAEEDEPAQLVVSCHHARELVTPVIALYALEQLAGNYGQDATVTALVNEYEIWIAPVWNPDGYSYVFGVDNMWRKNRRVFLDGVGVDLNRNYPFGWDTTCGGDTEVTSNTYKGPGPVSEAETQTMIAWTEDRGFAKVLDFHSSGQYVIYTFKNCWASPLRDFWLREGQFLSVASGYGGNASLVGNYGEHFLWQQARRGAYAFLTETAAEFQPQYKSAQAEAAQVYPSIIAQLQRPIPLSGHVADAISEAPLAANISYPEVDFENGESNVSNGRFGRYHVFLPAGAYTVEYSADGYRPQRHAVNITSDTAQVLEVGLVPCALNLSLSEKPAEEVLPGIEPYIEIEINGGTENLVPGSVTCRWRYDDGDFCSIALSAKGGDRYGVSLPRVWYGDKPEFYLTAQGDGGAVEALPAFAPSDRYSFQVVKLIFDDDFETEKGWIEENLGAASGDWQRGVPTNERDWPYDPRFDADGSGQCRLTENLRNPAYSNPVNTDVDGGAVRLTAPVIDMTGGGDFTIFYDYFLRLTDPNGADRLLVEINSNDGVGDWIEIARHDADGGLDWRGHEIDQAYLFSRGVSLTSTMRIRYTVNDADPPTIVEAAIDAVKVTMSNPQIGDTDGDEDVDLDDFAWFAGQWLEVCCGSCGGANLGGGRKIDLRDLYLFWQNWLAADK